MTLWDGSFPFYPGTNACFPFDTTWAIIASVFLSALVTSIIILPGIRGKGRLFWLLRVVTSLFIGAVVLRNPVHQVNETIDYNEHFAWSFDADYDHSYSEGLEKGLPSPILYVAEKFTTQSPCNVHRQYRISSRYASITLWMALCTWLISILLFSMPILLYGGYMLLLTAVLMFFSLLFFVTVRNIPKCPILFGPASLKTDYGRSFWLTLTTGECLSGAFGLHSCSDNTSAVLHLLSYERPKSSVAFGDNASLHAVCFRAALPAAGTECDCSQLCAPSETEACFQPGRGKERRSRWVGQVPPAS
uniref:Dual oxidase maturation factor 1 n=1 Tax=Phasianus colchicus TaxID=9054 RepID=A0A669PIE2_PHACC